ncbi:MAG: RNA polymerase sigma factor [Bacillaceae bacterium]|nr:RNA polymerase sigma factor [Bacillaceae bacterium]
MLNKWIHNSKTNDEETEKVIFDLFYKKVYQTAYFITRDTHLAQDAAQETFIKAFRHLDKIEDVDKIGGWITTIASRTAIDLIRKQNRWNGIPVEDETLDYNASAGEISSSVEKELLNKWDQEEIWKSIEHLPPKYRASMLLKYKYDMSDDEIARVLDEKVGTIKSRNYRAKNKIRATLKKAISPGGDVHES